jgi:hydrogenase expression/formation protein HypE
MVMTTDGYVVSPLFFPGGDIGSLAVHGTINDVAMGGAQPLYLSASFIIEEGFPFRDLKRIADSMGRAAADAGVPIVTGDTKVVERGKADGVFISTTGIGAVPTGIVLSGDRAVPGDVVLSSGSLGDHGVAIMSCRANLEFETAIRRAFRGQRGSCARSFRRRNKLRPEYPTRTPYDTNHTGPAGQSGW